MGEQRSKIAIVGTGLIGASIGLRLMARPKRSYEVVGADANRVRARTAKKLGAIDRDVGSLEEVIENAGLIVLAVPVVAAGNVLQEIGPYVTPGAVITDTCSTKAEVMQWAAEHLPPETHFIGGHPLTGKETSGPESAEASLFEGATWAITPSPRADEQAVNVVVGLIESMGAFPVHVDPAEHDQFAAAVSHVPILLSVALFRMVRDSPGWEDAALLSGPAFKDLTRLASGDPRMSLDIMGTNREAVLHWLQRYRQELQTIEEALTLGGDTVKSLFESTSMDRDAWLLNPRHERKVEGVDLPSSQDAMGQLLVGGNYDRLKKMMSGGGGLRPDQESEGLKAEEMRRKLGAPSSDEELRRKLEASDKKRDR